MRRHGTSTMPSSRNWACHSYPEPGEIFRILMGHNSPFAQQSVAHLPGIKIVILLTEVFPRFFGPECFHFTENFLRASLPSHGPVHAEMEVTDPVTPQVTPQVGQLLRIITGEHSRQELQEMLGLADREHFRKAYLLPALEKGWIEPTLPDKPNSRLQKYRLTEKGKGHFNQP